MQELHLRLIFLLYFTGTVFWSLISCVFPFDFSLCTWLFHLIWTWITELIKWWKSWCKLWHWLLRSTIACNCWKQIIHLTPSANIHSPYLCWCLCFSLCCFEFCNSRSPMAGWRMRVMLMVLMKFTYLQRENSGMSWHDSKACSRCTQGPRA